MAVTVLVLQARHLYIYGGVAVMVGMLKVLLCRIDTAGLGLSCLVCLPCLFCSQGAAFRHYLQRSLT